MTSAQTFCHSIHWRSARPRSCCAHAQPDDHLVPPTRWAPSTDHRIEVVSADRDRNAILTDVFSGAHQPCQTSCSSMPPPLDVPATKCMERKLALAFLIDPEMSAVFHPGGADWSEPRQPNGRDNTLRTSMAYSPPARSYHLAFPRHPAREDHQEQHGLTAPIASRAAGQSFKTPSIIHIPCSNARLTPPSIAIRLKRRVDTPQ